MALDARGCQHAIAEQIVDQGGEYILGLKGNQRHRQEAVDDFFTGATAANCAGVSPDYTAEIDRDPDRLAVRLYWISETLCTLSDTER